MRSRFACVVCASALLIHSSSATAQDSVAPDYVGQGFYMGVSLEGAAYTEFSQSVEDLARSLGYVVDVKTDIPIGFNVYGGFRFHPNVAVEAEFEMMPGSDVKEFGLTAAEIETWAFTGNAKIFFLSDQMQQPFLLVGIGVLHAELKDTMGLGLTESADDFGARFGGGVDHYFTENVALSVRVTYVLATGSVDVFDYVSFGAGLQYRFY